jgi:hypothetical protein
MGWLVSPAKDGSYLCKWSLPNRTCLPGNDAGNDKVLVSVPKLAELASVSLLRG